MFKIYFYDILDKRVVLNQLSLTYLLHVECVYKVPAFRVCRVLLARLIDDQVIPVQSSV